MRSKEHTFGTRDELLLAPDAESRNEGAGRNESLQHDAAVAVK